ncbi:MAG: membrane lipoprotein lipid attachment site-containing protein [Verrucomicrobiota bacterium]|nr:membrane lipoprotein lipid attachment site-containing protein [Verrucomicrobiota bacterium]
MKKLFYPIVAALTLTGCLSGLMSSKLSGSHPANPAVAQETYAPLKPFLMSDTNLVVMTTGSTNAPEQGHEGHSNAKPESKKTEHKHEP